MTCIGVRRILAIAALTAVAAAATACSSGGGHHDASVNVNGDGTTVPGDASASATPSSTTAGDARAKASKKKATSKTTLSGSTVTVPVGAGGGGTGGSGPVNGQSGGGNGGGSGPVTSPPTVPPTTPPTTLPPYRPYDPSKPIDLGGIPGVTPAEQARAEKLVRETLRDLPHYASTNTAYNEGYRSIGDGFTGDEHWVNWLLVNDHTILDSKRPESLVYNTRNGGRVLEAAMYMMPLGSRFTDIPDVGGPMTQWHMHNDLCLADNPSDPLQKLVSGLVGSGNDCPPGTSKAGGTPMLHVWIVANECGPFAALEGVGAGQVPPGQTRRCDHGFR